MSYLSTIDVVQHKVEFVGGLERVMHPNKEGMFDVCHKYVPLRHDVFGLVLLHNVRLVEDLDRIDPPLCLVSGQQHLQQAPTSRV